ncbi:lipase 1-like [Cydia strobilella]|uniref:lipase 1-like n=1 Tax=Cydia strobilella TaxID=1100964 RepID=UPI0030046556
MSLVLPGLTSLVTLLSVLENQPEDSRLNFTELAIKYGHPNVEAHDVVTEDGYILTLFHIPGKIKGPVLLLHGIVDSADSFIVRGTKSLAITMANKGYDVWAGNTRGNKYSRRHIYLDPDTDPEFWNFGFEENGYYDLPAMVDFILNSTNQTSMRSIAHSQGTTAHFVLLSMRPEYNEKIRGLIALAPIAFLNNVIPPVSTLLELGPEIDVFLASLGINEILGYYSAARELVELICSQGIIGYDLCFILGVSPFVGFDPTRIEPLFWEVIMGHYPAGTSRKSLVHYDQVFLRKQFAGYDYGRTENFRIYHLPVPPDYNLTQITANVSLIVGKNDNLSRIKDVDILRSLLPREPQYVLLKPRLWNHYDFVWANDMDVWLFPYIFSFLKEWA